MNRQGLKKRDLFSPPEKLPIEKPKALTLQLPSGPAASNVTRQAGNLERRGSGILLEIPCNLKYYYSPWICLR